MSVRSLPHFAHKPIGKTTHKKGMTYAHVNYITREDACSKTLSGNMPNDRDDARPYFEREARQDGVPANARIADTLILALPLELSREQRHEAVASFMSKIGKDRIAWFAAFHDMGKDEHNPHCHVIFRDADIETGRKVVGTTTNAKDVREAEERGWRVPPRMTTKDLREAWCQHLNAEMERHGIDVRFDQRTLKEQGIDREAQIHVGPKANAMAQKRRRFDSSDLKRGDHANIYTLLDAGSRAEHNQRIIEENKRRAAGHSEEQTPSQREAEEKRALRERQSVERKVLYQEQARDRVALREAHDAKKLEHQQWGRALYATAREQAFKTVKEQTTERWKELRQIQDRDEREKAAIALKAQQKNEYQIASEAEVAKVRPIKDEAWQSLKAAQDRERKDLQQRHTQEVTALSRQQIAERHALHERWLHHHDTKRSGQLSARLETRQGMAPVQATAVKMIKMRARAEQHQEKIGLPAAPSLVAAAHFAERARAEASNRTSIRYQLNAFRQSNHIRAAEPAERRAKPGQMAARRAAIRAQILAEHQAKSANRQAMTAGSAISSSDRANASPEAKASLSSRDKARERREQAFDRFVQRQNEGKEKNGGRSGR